MWFWRRRRGTPNDVERLPLSGFTRTYPQPNAGPWLPKKPLPPSALETEGTEDEKAGVHTQHNNLTRDQDVRLLLSHSVLIIDSGYQSSQVQAKAWKEVHDKFKQLDDNNMREYSEEVDTVLVFVRTHLNSYPITRTLTFLFVRLVCSQLFSPPSSSKYTKALTKTLQPRRLRSSYAFQPRSMALSVARLHSRAIFLRPRLLLL
jgi:hypothetical protein